VNIIKVQRGVQNAYISKTFFVLAADNKAFKFLYLFVYIFQWLL